MSRRSRGWPGTVGTRAAAVLLACVGVALTLGVVALSASGPAPSFARSVLGTDDSVAVAIGDLNGDGRADIVTANYNPESISVGLNRGGGRFGNGGEYRVGGLARSVAIADVNGDGKPDLVAAASSVNPNSDPDTISVLPNTGDGRFGDRRELPLLADQHPGSLQRPERRRNDAGACEAHARADSCRVGKVSHAYSKGMKRGRVISTKPWFGAVLPKGGKVNLVISRGRKR